MEGRDPAFIDLRAVLAELFDDRASIRQFAKDAGLNVSLIAFSDRAINTWESVLEEAERNKCLTDLLNLVKAPYERLLAAITRYETLTSVKLPDAAIYKTPEIPRVPSRVEMQNVERWFKQRGFSNNPFANYEAESEDRLPEYFVDTLFYDYIWGNEQHPRSMIIAAERGCGKSAHRIMIARACRPCNPKSDILAVEYAGFDWPEGIKDPLPSSSLLDTHLALLLGASVDVFVDTLINDNALALAMLSKNVGRLKWFWITYGSTVNQPSNFYAQITNELRTYSLDSAELVDRNKFVDHWYASTLSPIFRETPAWECSSVRLLCDLVDTAPEPLGVRRISASKLYGHLVNLVRSVGLQAIYILVDGVDELRALTSKPEQVADLLGPLIAESPLMEVPGAAFKIFLPLDVVRALDKYFAVAVRQIPVRRLYWTEDALVELLAERLSVFYEKPDKPGITDMGQLCDTDLSADIRGYLINAAQGVPRRLLRVAEQLVIEHCRNASDEEAIRRQAWVATQRAPELQDIFGPQPAI